MVTLDSGYDLETLARAKVEADLLVRLIKSRVLYSTPERVPGPADRACMASRFAWPMTARTASRSERVNWITPAYGSVRIDAWTDLHVGGAPDAPLSVIRVQVERLPNKKLPLRPLWLAWIGGYRLAKTTNEVLAFYK